MIFNPTVSGGNNAEWVTGTLNPALGIAYDGEDGPVYESYPLPIGKKVKVRKNSILCVWEAGAGTVEGNLTKIADQYTGSVVIYSATSDFECKSSGPF